MRAQVGIQAQSAHPLASRLRGNDARRQALAVYV
jgi:hypothetical protein